MNLFYTFYNILKFYALLPVKVIMMAKSHFSSFCKYYNRNSVTCLRKPAHSQTYQLYASSSEQSHNAYDIVHLNLHRHGKLPNIATVVGTKQYNDNVICSTMDFVVDSLEDWDGN